MTLARAVAGLGGEPHRASNRVAKYGFINSPFVQLTVCTYMSQPLGVWRCTSLGLREAHSLVEKTSIGLHVSVVFIKICWSLGKR